MWRINDKQYFEAPGLSLLMFHDFYPEGKQGAIELIHHGSRVITNGDVRLENSQDQWAKLPKTGHRQVDSPQGMITLEMEYDELAYLLRTWTEGENIHIAVDLPQALSESLIGKAAFQFEIYPADYWGKTFHLGETQTIFPRQANGAILRNDQSHACLTPLGEGTFFSAAPEEPTRWFTVERNDGGLLSLYDGRDTSQHHWFVLRAELLPGQTRAAEVILWANALDGWKRAPVILCSQVGYHPRQKKIAWIELDANDTIDDEVKVQRINPDGRLITLFSAKPRLWGTFLRYNYASCDFSSICEPGMYQISYAGQVSSPFQINTNIYRGNVWQPTLDTFLPVQMCHMAVRDRYQVWHGACHLDDAVQAPVNHNHFDGYRQGATTDSGFEPYQHIPGLNLGGWHDAGDYDLAAGSQAATTYYLALAREAFGIDSDHTTVDWENREVHLHQPDGIPDIVEQIKHGVENLLGGYRTSGHSFCGIIAGRLSQYVHQGDASTMTDNRIDDDGLARDQQQAIFSGKKDDRWVFTNHDSALEYRMAAVLAASSRVLKGFYDDLAVECLQTAQKVWEHEQHNQAVEFHNAYVPRNHMLQSIGTAVELMLTTGDHLYQDYLKQNWDMFSTHPKELLWMGPRIIHLLNAPELEQKLQASIIQYRQDLQKELDQTPFGIAFRPHIWGEAWNLQSLGVSFFYLTKAYPHIFEKDLVYQILHYVLGVHPASSISLISGVGARSLTTAFGNNRADFSYIPGGGASGPNLIRPDFPELKEGFPFIWQQAEYVIGGAATYIFCVLAVDHLLNE